MFHGAPAEVMPASGVGGEDFDTMLRGGLLRAAGSLRLRSLYLYLYQSAGGGGGHFFASFEPA